MRRNSRKLACTRSLFFGFECGEKRKEIWGKGCTVFETKKEVSISLMLLRMSALPITNSLDWACKLAYKLKSVIQSTRVRYWSCYRPLNVSLWKEMSNRVIVLLGQTRNVVGHFGCLPFTWANRFVHGSGKWRQAKSHLPLAEQRPREPEIGIIYGFEEM